MTTLITGGSGFVGLNLAEFLLGRGEEVVLFGPSPPPAAATAALHRLPGRLSMIAGDVCSAADLDAALAAHPVTRIAHGAAVTADRAREERAAREIFSVNVLGTIEVLEAALRHRVRRVVQLGTGSIFGAAGRASAVLDEVSSPVFPETMYGISKFAAERTGLRYRGTRGLNLTVARLGTVFGRWEYATGVRDTLSLPLQLLGVAEAGGAAVVHAQAPDDWVYSQDVARGLAALLDLPASPEGVYHLSAGMRWSVADWCARLKERFPAFSYRLTDDLDECTIGRNNAALRSPMSIERIRRDAGYAPAFPPARAFEDFLAWHAAARRDGWA
ncbi:MAG: NAD(P)-dependent oxidoreductase [Burkholderiales bacterium]|nr:NAD(P)-dependent oxidoreductase [Burkholderiales bacterium]